MASSSGGRKKQLVSSLDGEVLERLSMKLNPRMLLKDYQSLAGRLKYTYEFIRNFERERDPTLALLQHWWSSKRGKEKTVSALIEHLSDMERDDAVELLRPHEFCSSHNATEYDEITERPVVAGATDLAMNPYNPYFPTHENHQRQGNEYGTAEPEYQSPAAMTSESFQNANSFSSVSSSMDSVEFEKYFMENADGFHGARRDLRRPRPPNAPSAGSNKATMGQDFMGSPSEYNRMMATNNIEYQQHVRTGVDRRCWPRGYQGHETSATAATHSDSVAADKVALVIGNQDYGHKKLRGLLYPEQDAADVADALRRLDFKVISLVNLTLTEMRTAMLAFCCLLGRGVYGVVYYAGHGYEDNGENYLLPVDSDLKYNREHSLRTQEILEAMQQCETSLNLLIIDACRVSLPNKSGTTVPRIKRAAKGNNIFAYSCCSQQESLETLNSRNGMYCSLLLRRLGENRRVEDVLMDVTKDFAQAYCLPQRPCFETDAILDFRLTDPIVPGTLEQEYTERCRRWLEAQRQPYAFPLASASLQFALDFYARFSNVLCVSVVTAKRMDKCIEEFHLGLETVSPLVCEQKVCQVLRDGSVICKQLFEVQNIQKHMKLDGAIILTVKAMFREDGKLCHFEKELDLGWPLVSSITCLWDRWLLGDRCKMTAV